MSGEYPHLHPSTRPFADEDAQSRIRRIRTDRWIGYARAKAVLAALEDLLSFPKRMRMPNHLLGRSDKQRQDHDRGEVPTGASRNCCGRER